MTTSFIWAVLLQGALASSASLGRQGIISEGSTSAVLSAAGNGYLMNAASAQTNTLGTCTTACNDYTTGVSENTLTVCMRTGDPGTCSDANDASNPCDTSCLQKFEDSCVDSCSEWVGGADNTTLNVCMSNPLAETTADTTADQPRGYLCSGARACSATETRCKQKPLEDCWYDCAKFTSFKVNHTVDIDTKLVCQNMDAGSDGYGDCMPLPCAKEFHNSDEYKDAQICKQVLKPCPNTCVTYAGDEPLPASICYSTNSWAGSTTNRHCTNPVDTGDSCTADMTIRCKPIFVEQDTSKIDASTDFLEVAGKSVAPSESHTEQQHAQRRSVMRRDTAEVGVDE